MTQTNSCHGDDLKVLYYGRALVMQGQMLTLHLVESNIRSLWPKQIAVMATILRCFTTVEPWYMQGQMLTLHLVESNIRRSVAQTNSCHGDDLKVLYYGRALVHAGPDAYFALG